MVNFCGIHLYPPGREQLRRVWRVLTCSSSPEAEWEEFDGAMVQEGSCRTKVRTTTRASMPYCMPLIMPKDLDAETLRYLRSR